MLTDKEFSLHVEQCLEEYYQTCDRCYEGGARFSDRDHFLNFMWPEDSVVPAGITNDEWRDVLREVWSQILIKESQET